jgi:hypothetical protein
VIKTLMTVFNVLVFPWVTIFAVALTILNRLSGSDGKVTTIVTNYTVYYSGDPSVRRFVAKLCTLARVPLAAYRGIDSTVRYRRSGL